MNIGIIGSGHIGGTAARLFARAGDNVAISHSSGPESLRPLVEDIGFAPVDTGPLSTSSRQEPGAPIYNNPMKPPQARAAVGSK